LSGREVFLLNNKIKNKTTMKYSNIRMFIEYILIAFAAYLILSLVVSIIGGFNYREVLCSTNQICALMFLYWWIPIFRMCDMENENSVK
jgi:hypothetical protein